MSNIKKAFQPIVAFLEDNKNKKVDTVLQEVKDMCAAKGAGGTATTVHRDENGNVIAIHDYYFKQWMPLSHVEFGAKAGSASGFNTMSKEGVSNWSKQQRDYRKGKEELLELVGKGEVAPDEIQARLEQLEEDRKRIIPRADGIGFDTIEELLETDPAELDRMVEAAQPAEVEEETESAE